MHLRKAPFSNRAIRRLVLTALAGVALFAALWPFHSEPFAAKALTAKPVGHEESFPNYDIRTDKNARERLIAFRSSVNRNASEIADVRDAFVRGENLLKGRVGSLKVEYNNDIRTPEIIAPDATQAEAVLARSAGKGRPATLRSFLEQNNELVGTRSDQISDLVTAADYTNPDGKLSFVELDQEINGIPVFRGEIKAGFDDQGNMFRVINNLAPGLDYASLSTDFGDPVSAVTAAESCLPANSKVDRLFSSEPVMNYELSTSAKAVFGTGDEATTAEKIYFPTEPGVAVPAWRVLVWQPVNAYYVIVDAASGTMLWRKDISEDQTQPAVYDVFTNPQAMINVAHNPFPVAPYPLSPNGIQGPRIKLRSVQRIGNEPPYEFNQLGWMTDGTTRTDGNAVQAGLDRDGTQGIDTNSEAFSPTREFRFAYHPVDPSNNHGDPPVPATQTYPGTNFQQGAITQLFYICNWYHDEAYRLGFTEAARNFQNVNFLGQGVAGDRVGAEAQDSLSTNNANFSTAADGVRGRMQMYIFTGSNPDIDGSLDADVVVHEHTHGLSNRLHGNASGLTLDIARGMGEGWSDFYALSMLTTPNDPVNGVYPTGTYVTYHHVSSPTFVSNNYYGIRRFPYAVRSEVGANGKPHNPLTFADIDQTQMNLTDGAFPRGPVGGSFADEVHNIGEIWCSALWEIRARMIGRLGAEVGNRRMLQFVTDGMKLAPLNPTPLTERDAMIAGAVASGTAQDVQDMWAGFAIRGLGAGAAIQAIGGNSIGGTGTVRVSEAFDLPNLVQSPDITISDASGNNNGVADPGETVAITVPLTNNTGITASGATAELVGSGTQSYSTIPHASTISRTFAYSVPSNTPCGAVITVTLNVNSSLGPKTFTRTFAVGSPVTTFTENFDAVTPPATPSGWTVSSTLPAMTFVATNASSDTAPISMFAADPTVTGGSTELTSPVLPMLAQAATVSFRHKFNSESGWDGGVLEISFGGGPWQDIVSAGGTFLQNGYNSFMATSTGNPIGNRFGWTGDSGGYITTVARMPAAAAGQNIQLRWRFGADSNTAPVGGGWNVDSIEFSGSFACTPIPPSATVTVSGHVIAYGSFGLRDAGVILTDSTGRVFATRTGGRGTFSFTGVPVGSYMISIKSKRFSYAPVAIDVKGDVGDIEISPDESQK
jgi:hypothetical protein